MDAGIDHYTYYGKIGPLLATAVAYFKDRELDWIALYFPVSPEGDYLKIYSVMYQAHFKNYGKPSWSRHDAQDQDGLCPMRGNYADGWDLSYTNITIAIRCVGEDRVVSVEHTRP